METDFPRYRTYAFKTKPKKGVLIPLECAVKGEELVRLAIAAETPLELAELFYKHPYLNGNVGDKMFNHSLDLTEKTKDSMKSLILQDNLYFLNFIDYAKNQKVITEKKADKAILKVLYSMNNGKKGGK